MWKDFLKTNDAINIFILDHYGYPIVTEQSELTRVQEMFILLGKPKFDKKLNDIQEKKLKQANRAR